MASPRTDTCSFCGLPTGASGMTLTLWDGRHYCRACVNTHSPVLWDYALAHGSLREEPSPRLRLLHSVRKAIPPGAVVLLMAIITVLHVSRPPGTTSASGQSLALLFPWGVLLGAVLWALYRVIASWGDLPPAVTLHEGVLTCEEGRRSWVLHLSECSWRRPEPSGVFRMALHCLRI